MWKIAKWLTHRLTLHIMKILTCAIIFSPLAHQHSLQSTPESVTVFFRCGFSLFSRLAKAPPGCSASPLTLGDFVTNALFDASFLVKMYWSLSSLLFWYFRFFSITFHDETVVVIVYPYLFLMPWHWTTETRWSWPPKPVGSIFTNQTRFQNS